MDEINKRSRTAEATDLAKKNGNVRDVVAGDLLDENFLHPRSYMSDEIKLSGWDTDTTGGYFEYAEEEWFRIVDSSSTSSVRLKKGFVGQNKGKIVLELRFMMPENMDGVKWQLCQGDIPVISLVTSEGRVCFTNSREASIPLESYVAGQECGVKVIADISSKKADIYIDGHMKASGLAFKNQADALDTIVIETGIEAVGALYLGPVRIYKGYALFEKFLSVAPGVIPDGWILSGEKASGGVQTFACNSRPDILSFKMENPEHGKTASLFKRFGGQSGKLAAEFRFYLPKETDGTTFELMSGDAGIVSLTTKSGYIYLKTADGALLPLTKCRGNLWHYVKLIIDTEDKLVDVFINYKPVCKKNSIMIVKQGLYIDCIRFTLVDVGILWVDDILVFALPVEPEDYVPVPELVSSSPYIIGMQNCSLWREGTHNGWDWISDDPQRKPYLGWYDEGSPEVADWEIKWMVEHGVTCQMYCWFRPYSCLGSPVKEPSKPYGLDAFFNAKYSDRMKFLIMWEQGVKERACADIEDFKENIVPYWIEYYIKDSRYMTIDNKPVIVIFNIDGLVRDMGSIENVRIATDYLRQACIDAGYDGAILLCEHRFCDSEAMERIKAAGFEYIYAYSYIVGDTIKQKDEILAHKNKEKIDVIATVSMGWETTAWGGFGGGWASVKGFRQFLKWVRDEYMPSNNKDSLASRMIILDNWNEYGEGHFFMPSSLCGFGYLDGLREIYTSGGRHDDLVPTERQKARFDTLYPREWKT